MRPLLSGLVLGILAGLALSRLPRYPLFRDQPKTPEDWTPKFRRWKNGELTEWEDDDRLK